MYPKRDIVTDVATFGDRLKARRKQLKLTQEELSKLSGVAQATIARIERGDTSGPKGDTERRIATALKTTPEYLAGGAAQPELTREPEPEERAPDEDETPLETALFKAMARDPDAFTPRDFDLARQTIRQTHQFAVEGRDEIAVATDVLRAAQAVRLSGQPATVVAVLARWAYGKQDAAQRTRDEQRADELTEQARQAAIAAGFDPDNAPRLTLPRKKGTTRG